MRRRSQDCGSGSQAHTETQTRTHRTKTTEKRSFDQEAAAWDEAPARVRLASDIAEAIARRVAPTPDMDVLDFGCGTGLVSLALATRTASATTAAGPASPDATGAPPLCVRSVTGVDSSQGMLDVLTAKAARLGLANVHTRLCDLDAGDALTGPYHLVISSMTLHHIRAVAPLLAQCHRVLAPGGHLCIADLDPDGGQFHADNTGIYHMGFERAALRHQFEEAGFADVRDKTAAEITRPAANGEMRRFTVFLMSGRKARIRPADSVADSSLESQQRQANT